jgi:rubrerythrin
MNKKQTAVQWLNEQLDSSISLHSYEWHMLMEWMQNALAMEEAQIIHSYVSKGYLLDGNSYENLYKEAQDYYNENYIIKCTECGYLEGWYGKNDLIYNCSICNPKAI